MRCKLLVCLLLFLLVTPEINAQSALDSRYVVVVYSAVDEGQLYMLEATLAGLFERVDVVKLDDVVKEHIQLADIVVAFGETGNDAPNSLQVVQQFEGQLLAIGGFVEQLPQFTSWTVGKNVPIHFIAEEPLHAVKTIRAITVDDDTEVLVKGRYFDTSYPLVMKKGNVSYMNMTDFDTENLFVLSRLVYDLLNIEKPVTHSLMLWLEDISPLSNAKEVELASDYLLNRGIPLYLAITPIHVERENGRIVTFDDNPALKEVLQTLVERGANLIVHGYNNTYHLEQAEDVEFWDTLLNQPITALNPQEQGSALQSQSNFPSKDAYRHYLSAYEVNEMRYIQGKLTNAIHTLVDLQLPPVAFTSPGYAMSRNGYVVTSHYFSTIVGQMQLSEMDWQETGSPFFISKPTLLNGMTLYPETIFIERQLNEDAALAQQMVRLQLVPGAFIGGGYSLFLGTEYLKEVVEHFERLPNTTWVTMREQPIKVQTDKVSVHVVKGKLVVVSTLSWIDDVKKLANERPLEIVLWGIVLLTAIFVALFAIYIFIMRVRYRKRLFEERG